MTDASSPCPLDAEAVARIMQAYQDAWNSLQGSIFTAPLRAEETRKILVRCIIETAERGERDPIHLRNGALSYFGMAT